MSEWRDGYNTGKLEMFAEIMQILDENIYGPYKNNTMRVYARNIRAQVEDKFTVFYSEIEDNEED